MARRKVELLSPHGDPRNVNPVPPPMPGNAARDDNGTCLTCGTPMFAYHRPDCLFEPKEPPVPESVLVEAARLVDGDRQAAYGHPKDNHACTAELWTAYLRRRYQARLQESAQAVLDARFLELDAFDVCMLNILQKVSRLAHSRQRDGLTDIAGFARNAELVEDDLA